MRAIIGAIALLLSVQLAAATFPEDYAKILLPIIIQTPTEGAFGSEWLTNVAITNTGDHPVSILGYYPIAGGCQLLCPPTPDVPPQVTFYPTVPLSSDAIAGYFLYVERGHEEDVHVALRVQDLSRQAETWGTELPVVPEAAFLTSVGVLEDIPVLPQFRSNIRVYDLNANAAHAARIKLYAVDPSVKVPRTSDGTNAPADRLLLDRTFTFSVTDNSPQSRPGMIYFDLFNLPELTGIQRVRAEVMSANSDGLQFWTFASVTNNTTQHVTTISPR